MKPVKILIVISALFIASLYSIKYFSAKYPPLLGGDFTIPSTQGEFNLKDYRDSVVLIYFGYRFCPDVCPTTLSQLANIYKDLGEPKNLKILFISVDQKRDTLKSLAEYVAFFHKDFIAGTDNQENLKKLADQFGIRYEILPPKPDQPDFYLVDHSAMTLIINKEGLLQDAIADGESTPIAKKRIEKYLKEEIK